MSASTIPFLLQSHPLVDVDWSHIGAKFRAGHRLASLPLEEQTLILGDILKDVEIAFREVLSQLQPDNVELMQLYGNYLRSRAALAIGGKTIDVAKAQPDGGITLFFTDGTSCHLAATVEGVEAFIPATARGLGDFIDEGIPEKDAQQFVRQPTSGDFARAGEVRAQNDRRDALGVHRPDLMLLAAAML